MTEPRSPNDRDVQAETASPRTRRDALSTGAALAAAAGLALVVTARPRRAAAQAMGDNALLNALLTAEYQAIKAYDAGAMILMNPPMGDALASAAPTVLAVAAHFRQQHRDHAMKLAATITAAGGTPVQESSVMFAAPAGFTPGVANVIKLAANAEKAAAIAYTDTLRQMDSQTNAEIIASIGGVEAQHFIVLSLLAQGVVAPTAATMTMATDVVPASFVVSAGGASNLEMVPDFTY